MTATVETGTTPKPTRRTLGHQPALDGLRGIAVAGVLLYHLGQANSLDGLQSVTKGGFLGVSAFLTLSGFLITSLLILEYESIGHISLGGFWSRRFRRLMPASLLTLAAVTALTPLVGSENQLRELPGEVWAALGYVANWQFIAAGSDYADTFNGAPSPLKHFWSLAVEEQAYLLLPFLVAITMKVGSRRLAGNRRGAVAAVFAAIVVASTAATILQGGGKYANAVYMGTHTRIAELAVGGLLAVVLAGRTTVRTTGGVLATSLGGPLALGMIVAAWATTDLRADWLYRGGLTAHAAVVALVIAAAIQPRTPMQGILAVRPLTELGRISYGVYLFHWPVLWWLTPDRLHLPAAVAAVIQVALTLTLATVSLHLVEQPIRVGRLSLSGVRLTIPAAIVAAIALGAYALPEPDLNQIVALSASDDAVIPTTVAPSGPDETLPPPPVRVMVVGDSFALSVGLGLEHWANESGQIGVLNTGIVGCGFGRGGMNRGINLEREWPDACKERDQILAQKMGVFQPDIVLLTGGMWDITDRKLDGTDTWTHVGEPVYDAYLEAEFRYLTDFLGSTGATVVWTTAPTFSPEYNPQTFMGKPPYYEARPGRSERYNEILRRALEARPDSRVVDLAKWMQAFPGGEFSPNLRIDGVHFTEVSTDIVAREFLGPELVKIGRADS